MRGPLLLVILGLTAGVALVLVLAQDPGYVLLQRGDYRVETTVVALGIMTVFFLLAARLVYRVLVALLGIAPGVGRWLEKRKENRESELVRESFTDVLAGRDVAFNQKLGKLERVSWFSEVYLKEARDWVFTRQLATAQKRDKLKRLWQSASTHQKHDPVFTALYAGHLLRVGAASDVEAQLLGLADKGWPIEATAVLAQLRVSKPDMLISKLTKLTETAPSGDAATGLVIAKAQAMSGDQGQQLLTDYYATHRSADIVTALGTLFLNRA
ncbi:heme biosynthesis HemY N-terminal domain-containing protein [Luminiphilus sp.]|nr:heme biosynthesis HemY N-terminal domain-containing protein [Luminiphilus sp.]